MKKDVRKIAFRLIISSRLFRRADSSRCPLIRHPNGMFEAELCGYNIWVSQNCCWMNEAGKTCVSGMEPDERSPTEASLSGGNGLNDPDVILIVSCTLSFSTCRFFRYFFPATKCAIFTIEPKFSRVMSFSSMETENVFSRKADISISPIESIIP